jgi:hypothetical protein
VLFCGESGTGFRRRDIGLVVFTDQYERGRYGYDSLVVLLAVVDRKFF